MYIAARLRDLREAKKLSQGDIEKRTGLLRCYVSRVENGHTVPAVETLEKFARALEVPMYQLFYEGDGSAVAPTISDDRKNDWASQGKGKRLFTKLRVALSLTNEADRSLLLGMAKSMSSASRRTRH